MFFGRELPRLTEGVGAFGALCLAFACFWCWFWVGFQSPVSLTAELAGSGIVVPSRSVSLLVFAATSLVLFRFHRRGGVLRGRAVWLPRVAIVLCVVIIVGCDIAEDGFDGKVGDSSLLSIPMGMAFGVVGSMLYVAWAQCLAALGRVRYRLVITACIISCLGAVALSAGFYYVSDTLRQAFMVAFLIVSYPLIRFFRASSLFQNPCQAAHRPLLSATYIPRKFLITLFMIGVALGLMQAIFTLVNQIDMLGPLTSAGSVAAAVLVAAAVFGLDLDFNRLLYQIGFPLMALGFLLLLITGRGFWGYLLSVTGYRFCEVVSWLLCIYLTAHIKGARGFLFPLLACMLSLGQALGLLCYDGRAEEHLAQISLIAEGVLFMSAILLVTSKGENQSWGIVVPAQSEGATLGETISDMAAAALFTPREAEVFALLARGKNKRAISEDLVLSENTIKTHIGKVYRKLGIGSQQELIAMVEQRMEADCRRGARAAGEGAVSTEPRR